MNNTLRKTEWQALNYNFSKLEHKILDYIINRGRMKLSFRASYQTIANRIGCHEKTIRRAINKFISFNLITKFQRDFMDICDFVISKSIYDFADYFRYKFDSLKKHYNLGLRVDYLKKLKQNVRPLCSNLLSKIYIPRKSMVVDNQLGDIFQKRGDFLIKREDMEVSPPKISPTLREVTEKLRLTRLGQLKLMVFPEDVLSSVWSGYKKLTGVNDPFALLMAQCLKRCQNKRIVISWDLFYVALNRYQLEDNKKYTFAKSAEKHEPVKVDLATYRKHVDKKEPHSYWGQFIPKELLL